MLNKIEVLDKPTEVKSDMHLTLTPAVLSGNDVLTVEDLKNPSAPRRSSPTFPSG